jgi:cold shock protein
MPNADPLGDLAITITITTNQQIKECTMLTGEITMFDHNRGYGFLRRTDGEPDVFLHVSALEAAGIATVAKGDWLSFEIESDSKRPDRSHAINLRILDASDDDAESAGSH